MPVPAATQLSDEGAAIAAVAEEVFTAVEVVRCRAVGLSCETPAEGGRLPEDAFSGLRDTIVAQLHDHADLLIGLGMVVAPGLLAGRTLGLEWWQHERGMDECFALHVDLNQLSSAFFDYESAEWFNVPRRTGERHIVGPYVDVGCTGRYLLTFTAPVACCGRFLGVAGADVTVERFEERLLRDLSGSREVLVVNGDGRIVFSNSPYRLTGDRLDDQRDAARDHQALAGLPWRVEVIH